MTAVHGVEPGDDKMKRLKERRMAWAIRHRSVSRLDGERIHFDYDAASPRLFRSRAAARRYIEEHFAYFRCADLKAEPHGWKFPQAVPVNVSVDEQ